MTAFRLQKTLGWFLLVLQEAVSLRKQKFGSSASVGDGLATFQTSGGIPNAGAAQASFINPVINQNAPDPGVAKFGDTWFMVSTSAEGTNATGAFPIRTSKDLVNWTVVGQVFPPGGVPRWSKSDYWAPEIHRVGNKYHVYYSARESFFLGRLGIGVAVADSPGGPYRDMGTPLILGSGPSDAGGVIDGHFFADTDGRQYLFWKVNQIPPFTRAILQIRELSADGLSFIAPEKTILGHDLPWEGDCVEAPWMIKRGGEYYLFYSAEHTWATRYAVGVARASSIMGPYTKSCAPVLSQFASDATASMRKFATTGHCSIVETEHGFVMIYHVYNSDDIRGDRIQLVDRISWDSDGWPRVGTCNAPTLVAQPMPAEEAGEMPVCLKQDEVYQMGWNAGTSPITVGSSSFYVRQGNCPGGAVSFESVDKPGHFVRHKDHNLMLERDDGSDLFRADSSFMAPPGLVDNSPTTTSLRPVNYPYHFVLRQGRAVGIAEFTESSQYAMAATWAPVVARG